MAMSGDVQSKPPMDMHPPVNYVNNINGVDKPNEEYQNGDGDELEGGEQEAVSQPKKDGEADTLSKLPTTT
jgi:hypothetical protein